jgi:cytochrome P450
MANYDDNFRMKKRLLESCLFDRGDIMSDAEDKIVQMVVKICYEFDEQAGTAFNPRDVIACGVMNMITLILFNEEYAYNDSEFIKLLYTMDIRFKCGYSQIGDFLPLLKFIPSEKARLLHFTHNMLRAFTYQQINQHKEDYMFEPTEFKDVVDRFLRRLELNEDCGAIKDMDLICMLIDLMSQSFEPVTATLEWTLLYMAAFPAVQNKVQQEIDSVIGRDRLPKLEDRTKLPYTRATIYEIQRMSTVMPLMFPHYTVTGTKLLGLFNFS